MDVYLEQREYTFLITKFQYAILYVIILISLEVAWKKKFRTVIS